MVRFAFSPTHDMTIDELRIALKSYALSEKINENFIIRIDDINKETCSDIKEQEMLGILELFGIKYTQVVHQSQNVRFHTAMALDLLHKKKAFSCFCSDNWIEKKKNELESKDEPYYYDDACRNLPAELVIDNTAPFCIRIIRPEKSIDTLHPNTIDSFLLMNQDKTPTKTFSSAVDDMLSDISIILTSQEELLNSARAIHIRDSLGYNKSLKYIFLDNIDNENISIKKLLEDGYLPQAIRDYILSLGEQDCPFSLEDLQEINKKTLQKMDARELSRYVGFADEEIGELARCYTESINTTKELKEKIDSIFSKKNIPKESLTNITHIKDALQEAPFFDNYSDLKEYLLKSTQINNEEVEKSLSLLLTNKTDTQDIENIYKHLKNYLGELIKWV